MSATVVTCKSLLGLSNIRFPRNATNGTYSFDGGWRFYANLFCHGLYINTNRYNRYVEGPAILQTDITPIYQVPTYEDSHNATWYVRNVAKKLDVTLTNWYSFSGSVLESAQIKDIVGYTFYSYKYTDANSSYYRFVLGDKACKIEEETVYARSATVLNGGGSISITGGSGFYTEGAYYMNGSSLTLTATPYANYEFIGWTDDSGSAFVENNYAKADGSTVTFKDNSDAIDVVLYASFRHIGTITFSTEAGSLSVTSKTGTVGEYITLPDASIGTRTGYFLKGWLIDDVEYAAGASYLLSAESVSATAVWRRPTVYVVNSNTSYGTLKLYKGDTVAAYLTATEANGILAADVSDGTYTIVCERGNMLYRGAGVGSSETSIIWPAAQVNGENTTTFTLSGSLETTFFYEKNGTYKITLDCSPSDGGSAIIHKKSSGSWPTDMTKASDADETVDGVPKWVAQTLRFVITPATGYDCASLHVVDAVDGTSSQPAVANPPAYPNAYTCDLSAMDDDVRVDLIFTKRRFDVEVGVDDASASVGVATVNDSDAGVSDVEYGTSVTYKATLKDGVRADGYRFEGWYLDGLKISEDAEFAYEITKAVRIVAKFAAKFAIGVAFTDNRSDISTAIAQAATLVLNGTTHEISAPATNAAFVVLGASASWTVTPGADWYFNAFYAPSDTAYANALEYERIGSIAVVSEATHIVARLTTVKIQSSAVVKVHVNDPATDVPPDASDPVVTASGFETAIADEGYSFVLDGTGSVTFTAKATVDIGGVTYAFNCFATDVPTSAAYKVLSRELTYKRTLNSPKVTIYALYGAFAKVDVSVVYGSGSDRTMGSISIDDETNEGSGAAKVTKNVEQGTTVTVKATVKNGYRFYGWYFGGNVSGEPDETSATLEVFVTSERTILAAFEKARDAVYEWEGSSENKMMEWKSKVYVAARPFNPSALRVDTNGYPVGEMCVGMFSAPDAEETAVSVLKNVASQDSRRLPKRRPERYIQVTVKNDQEVDRVLVGTSMEGVSV